MKEEEIMNLVAGNELNVLVATKVMGRTFPTVEEMKEISYKQWEDQPDCIHFFMGFDAWLEDGEFKWKYNAEAYSTDISKAWQVVDKLQSMDFDFSIYSTDDYAEVSFFKMEDKKVVKHAEEDGVKVSDAICKCALLVAFGFAERHRPTA
jgi:hypothetical protein